MFLFPERFIALFLHEILNLFSIFRQKNRERMKFWILLSIVYSSINILGTKYNIALFFIIVKYVTEQSGLPKASIFWGLLFLLLKWRHQEFLTCNFILCPKYSFFIYPFLIFFYYQQNVHNPKGNFLYNQLCRV